MEKLLNEEQILEIIKDYDIYYVDKKESYFIQLPYEKAKELTNLLCKYWINDTDIDARLLSNVIILNLTKILPNVLCSINKLLALKMKEFVSK